MSLGYTKHPKRSRCKGVELPLPLFISFEGGEGSGKTSLAENISARLSDSGYQVLLIHEPGTTPLGVHLRDLLKRKPWGDQTVSIGAELFLFSASRAELVTKVIKPAIDQNRQLVLIADRYVDSTVAYQGYGRKLPIAQIEAINDLATQGIIPDHTFLLDLPPEEGLKRTGSPQISMPLEFNDGLALVEPRIDEEGTRRFENESLEFHERVRAGYHKLVEEQPERWEVIDASRTASEVELEVWKRILQFLPESSRQISAEITLNFNI